MRSWPWRSILITGASSGIGAALAAACAAPGVVLHLTGRDETRLGTTAEAASARGATVHTHRADVCDAAAMRALIESLAPLDLVIANAGISGGTAGDALEGEAQVRAIFATNLDGVLNTALPALDLMRAQTVAEDGWRGHIAVIASVAAAIPAPGAPAYCASKAAADAWTVATARIAGRQGVHMISICPGYIRTPMTAANRFPMPGIMDADRAAGLILRGIARGKRRLAFPWWLWALARGLSLLPSRTVGRMLGRAEGKAQF